MGMVCFREENWGPDAEDFSLRRNRQPKTEPVQCMMRTPPVGAHVPHFLSITQFVMWEPCQRPVTYTVKTPHGWVRLCSEHEQLMREAQE